MTRRSRRVDRLLRGGEARHRTGWQQGAVGPVQLDTDFAAIRRSGARMLELVARDGYLRPRNKEQRQPHQLPLAWGASASCRVQCLQGLRRSDTGFYATYPRRMQGLPDMLLTRYMATGSAGFTTPRSHAPATDALFLLISIGTCAGACCSERNTNGASHTAATRAVRPNNNGRPTNDL